MGYRVSQTILDRLFPLILAHEGSIPHLYLDTANYVTVGIGFMLPNLEAAKKIGLQPEDKIEQDWNSVTSQTKGRVAAYYKQFTVCTLPSDKLRAEFDKRVQAFADALHPTYALDVYPDEAVLGILDMAYNLGAGALLKKWPKFKAACQAQDWKAASMNCMRKGIQLSRNLATSALFAKLAPTV